MNIDIDTFLSSNLFLGVPTFEKEKLWHGFLYMSESVSGDGIKIGYTNYDLKRRDKELKEFKSPKYMWSSPNPQILEKYVKQILVQFTIQDDNKYSDEVFYNIPIEVLVQTVRLIILYVITKEQWISGTFYYETLYNYFGGPPFNIIGSGKTSIRAYTAGYKENDVLTKWAENKWYEIKIVKKYTDESDTMYKYIWLDEKDKQSGQIETISEEELIREQSGNDIVFDLDRAYKDCGLHIENLKL